MKTVVTAVLASLIFTASARADRPLSDLRFSRTTVRLTSSMIPNNWIAGNVLDSVYPQRETALAQIEDSSAEISNGPTMSRFSRNGASIHFSCWLQFPKTKPQFDPAEIAKSFGELKANEIATYVVKDVAHILGGTETDGYYRVDFVQKNRGLVTLGRNQALSYGGGAFSLACLYEQSKALNPAERTVKWEKFVGIEELFSLFSASIALAK